MKHYLARLLFSAAAICLASSVSNAQSSGLLREVYSGITGSSIFDLTNAPAFPNSPSVTNIITTFEAPSEFDDNYGQRVRGYVVPPFTGFYTFWIASDDQSELYLSTDDTSTRKSLIAYVINYTASRDWSSEPNQQSVPIRLEAGKRYYIEALMKEGSGGDNLAVRWQLPNGAIEEPIPGERLLPFGSQVTAPVIRSQPANATALEGGTAVFSVELAGVTPANFQWQRNGQFIPGASTPSYTNRLVSLNDQGAHYRVVIDNPQGTVTSDEAVLTVIPDLTPPAIVSVVSLSNTRLKITFSEPVQGATRASGYLINNGVTVQSAAYEGDERTIVLVTTPFNFRSTYTLTINGVTDGAAARNPLPVGTRVDFTPIEFAPQDIGKPTLPSRISAAPDGLVLEAGGGGIGGTSDQFAFGFQERTGNFDLQVRLNSLGGSDTWAKAGLMARESLDPGSRFASILGTPSLAGSFFEYRATTNGASVTAGSQPVNYPDTWLRLQRSGDLFTGFASYDGHTWNALGSVTLPMTNRIYFGLAVTSRSTNQTTVAEFRELRNFLISTNTPAGTIQDLEPVGPSTRRTGLIISEIMYHPADRADRRNLEFIELCNTESITLDLGGFRLAGEVGYTVPQGTQLRPGEYLVIAPAPADIQAVYGDVRVIGGFTGQLRNGSGEVRVLNKSGAVLLDARYSGNEPWPAAADGAGHSLVLARPSYGEADPRAWAASDLIGGSPGRAELLRVDPYRSLVINEFLAHTDDPEEDYVELYNHGSRAIDLSGCILTDDPAVNRYVVPAGLVIQGAGFAVFRQSALGFSLRAAGEAFYLLNPAHSRVIDGVSFGPQALGRSSGRFPDGAPGFQPLSTKTPGAANGGIWVPDIAINEIMYNPISGDDRDEYLELRNRGTNRIDLSGWRLVDGVDYEFPSGTSIASGGYLAVAKDTARLQSVYTNLNSTNLVGDFQGTLANGGERVALAMPEDLVSTNAAGGLVTNRVHVVVDEVTYRDGGRWGKWSDGGGSSLELIDANTNHRMASNWADSDESAKGQWGLIEGSGVLDNGSASFQADHVEIILLGEGECLVDNVEVLGPSGANLVPNASFDGGLASWTAQGTHVKSRLEPEGYNSNRSLHIVASARGDTGPNIVYSPLLAPIAPGSTATIRARVRWLRGSPEILFRLHGNYLEVAGRMPLPKNLGTPGARNSRLVANAGPAIFQVSHSPTLPAAFQPVVVTTRVNDPDGISAVTLNYRIDPSVTVMTTNMVDNGSNGDAIAGDGIYSATIPGAGISSGKLVAFYVEAKDNARTKASTRFPNDAPARECLVLYGETQIASSFGTYRLWFTQATQTEWETRGAGSNEPLDATFVYGNSRVVYNMETLYSGSPFHWNGYNGPVGNNCNYMMTFPSDDLFLGQGDFVLNAPANLGSDNTAQREQTFFWMIGRLGQPVNYRRYHYMYVNGQLRGSSTSGFIFEDAQQPNHDFVEEWFPDDDEGDLHKIEDWFEYDPVSFSFSNVDASLELFNTTGGQKKLARYRWNWRKRAVQDSASNYTNLLALVDAANTTDTRELFNAVDKLVDVNEWMGAMALRHLVCDWDAYGYRRGKNMYAYKPQNGKWQLLHWDIAFSMGQGDGVNTDVFSTIEPVVRRMYEHPVFRRAYLAALQEAIDGPFRPEEVNPVLDERYAALRGNNLNVTSPSAVKSWIVSRRAFVAQTIASNSAPFSIVGQTNGLATSRNLITLQGAAPIGVDKIEVNGVAYPLLWTSVTNWSFSLPVFGGTTTLTLRGLDRHGQPLANAVASVKVTFNGPVELPEDFVVINEVMYHPLVPDAQYVEIHNTSTAQTFDLSDWRVNGIDFTFPAGSTIGPNSFLVLVKDQAAFAAAYGADIPVAGVFNGRLDLGGETLSLIKPGVGSGPDALIDLVTYDDDPPWPAAAAGGGASLQLIDPRQDHRRAGNWAGVPLDSALDSEWQYVSVSGFANGSNFRLYLESPGEVYIDDIALVEGVVPGQGKNLVVNGGFESALAGSWTVPAALATSEISSTIKNSGNSSLHLVATAGGSDSSNTLAQVISPALTSGRIYTLSFWYLPRRNAGELAVGLAGGVSARLDARPLGIASFTPGAVNSVRDVIAPFPPLWLNEIQVNNLNTISDHTGARGPWLELYNAGTAAVSLAGYYLSDSYTNLARWAFPAGAVVQAGQYMVVWLDGLPGNSTSAELHANFRPGSSAGAVALSRDQNGSVAVVDYINYPATGADQSFGSAPDGQPRTRVVFAPATPGASNSSVTAPVRVFINEWMAGNRRTIADPADGDYDDWFELYNAGTESVDLTGYYLTDNLTNTTKFSVPAGIVIPAGGQILIWADDETNQNGPGTALHVNFKLSLDGEEIGLYSPTGGLVDAVRFGAQSNDVSQGRAVDGGPGAFKFFTSPTPGGSNTGGSGGGTFRITSIATSSLGIAIAWNSVAGASYQVQMKDDLAGAGWVNLGGVIVANGPTASTADTLTAGQGQRFYRVIQITTP